MFFVGDFDGGEGEGVESATSTAAESNTVPGFKVDEDFGDLLGV